MALIEVKNAIKTYQMGEETFYALNDVSFKIKKGEFVSQEVLKHITLSITNN